MIGALVAATHSAAPTDEYLWVAALLCVSALCGYMMSARHHATRGVTPWRLPSLVWAMICFVLAFVGLLIEFLAELTTKPQLQGPPVSDGPPVSGFPSAATQTRALPVAVEAPIAIAPPEPKTPPPLFGWYPDPSGKHQFRYWDGRHWSEHVANGGVAAIDPP